MRTVKTLLATTALVLLLLPLSAHANLIWDWTGDCQRVLYGSDTPCTHATLHVVTTDAYIPGEEFFSPVLLEALYSDENTTFDLAFAWSSGGDGLLLPASFPGEGHMSTTATHFQSDVNGVWGFAAEGASPDCDEFHNPFCGYSVLGVNGVWTRVPEPSSLVLLGVGLAGLVFYRRPRPI